MMLSIVVQEHRRIRARYFAQGYRIVKQSVVVCAFFLLAAIWLQAQQDALHIDTKGNVGIGKDSPAAKLDVDGDMFLKGPLQIGGDGLGNKILLWQDTWGFAMQSYQLQIFMPYAKKGESSATDTARIAFGWGTSKTTASFNEVMRIQADGRVGIGTTEPAATLDVKGDINGMGAVPKGAILMWSGKVTELPAGWVLCDGNNGTPNLKGRFIVGYDSGDADYQSIGRPGGAKTVTLTDAQMDHSHSMSQTGSATGKHSHRWGPGPTTDADANVQVFGPPLGMLRGNPQPIENRPPYMVLAYIMYVGPPPKK